MECKVQKFKKEACYMQCIESCTLTFKPALYITRCEQRKIREANPVMGSPR